MWSLLDQPQLDWVLSENMVAAQFVHFSSISYWELVIIFLKITHIVTGFHREHDDHPLELGPIETALELRHGLHKLLVSDEGLAPSNGPPMLHRFFRNFQTSRKR